jgi:hypothetical protein
MRKRSWTRWQRTALGAELFNLSEFSMRLALSLAFEDSHRRLERRLPWRRPQPFQLPKGMLTPDDQ